MAWPIRTENSRRVSAVHAKRQESSQDTAAVHRKCRDQVEQRQHDVSQSQARGEADLQVIYRAGRKSGVKVRAEAGDQDERDQPVHGRSGKGNEKFLTRFLGHALDAGDTTDRQEGDVAGGDAEMPRGQDMTVFVQHHAAEHRENEGDRIETCCGSAVHGGREPEPQDEQKEREVDPNLGASHLSE